MPAYTGKDLNLSWVHTGGTVALEGDFRTFSYSPSVGLVEQTAGADAQKTYLTTPKDGQCSLEVVQQAAGTVLYAALAEGTSGTLVIGPEGTAAGKPKLTIPAISLGARITIPYADVVSVACDFQQNGARVEANF
jgi:hypothetical protein